MNVGGYFMNRKYIGGKKNIQYYLNNGWEIVNDNEDFDDNYEYLELTYESNDYTYRAIQMLVDAGIKTNIHYVLGNNSIDEAIERLENNDWPKGIRNIVFLLHKPVGQGSKENVLKADDPRVTKFFSLIDGKEYDFGIGLDSCSVPGLINFTKRLNPDSFDTCEGGRWSMYITSDMKALPCSFDNQELRWAYDISNDTIQNAWNSEQFEDFRNHFRNSCPNCKHRSNCMSGCPIRREIVLCNREERDSYESEISTRNK
jgi:radical SAM protein with 4Fe4S-binding SPASM domain